MTLSFYIFCLSLIWIIISHILCLVLVYCILILVFLEVGFSWGEFLIHGIGITHRSNGFEVMWLVHLASIEFPYILLIFLFLGDLF